MAKHLKINIKNEQLAKALNLGAIKDKLKGKLKEEPSVESKEEVVHPTKEPVAPTEEEPVRVRARSMSAFGEQKAPEMEEPSPELSHQAEKEEEKKVSESVEQIELPKEKKQAAEKKIPSPAETSAPVKEEPRKGIPKLIMRPGEKARNRSLMPAAHKMQEPVKEPPRPLYEKLGPTGKHINDLLPVKKAKTPPPPKGPAEKREEAPSEKDKEKEKEKVVGRKGPLKETEVGVHEKHPGKQSKFQEYKDIKPAKKPAVKSFDTRDRLGLRTTDEETHWKTRRHKAQKIVQEETIRPTSLKVRLPISIKDLAQEMKLKASQLIQKLLLQGMVVTINTLLDDEVVVQLLGNEFGCEIAIDTAEEKRIRITDKTIAEEIAETEPSELIIRPPVVAFMGHVDHGKTSLIDYIRESNRRLGEAGAITQHIGAFSCHTKVGDISILDTPGHEAFSSMRARGANVTDIVVLVVAGDEGIRAQTLEAIQHAKAAGVTIVVAINKCDKPNFNADNVYRQLSEHELLPEAWGGSTITINCSAMTGEGVSQLLEMLALQAEVLELKANPHGRARGSVLESEMHKGLGAVATILVQNGTLRKGDSLVFGEFWAKVKTMRDEYGATLDEAPPSTPVQITGLSGLPDAGQEFVVVHSEKEAKSISAVRSEGVREKRMLKTQMMTVETLLQQAPGAEKKVLNVILRGDVQGSVEALKVALEKIVSEKVSLNIIFTGVGEVSESDVQLALASKAVVIGFHTKVESHAEQIIKKFGVQVKLYDVIYHAIDGVKEMMGALLDKIAQESERGKIDVRAVFKSSQLGVIAGCLVTEGTVHRNNQIRLVRNGSVIWKGGISSLRRVKDDVREVAKGLECGIVLQGFSDIKEGDQLESYEITYIKQEL